MDDGRGLVWCLTRGARCDSGGYRSQRGAGVITDGHLLHAGSSSLVEIGHTQVDPYGKRCYCGNHGCLETIASVDSILELAQLRLNQSMSSMLHGQPLTVDSLCQAALRGDLLAKTSLPGWARM